MNRIDAAARPLAAYAPFEGSPDRIWADFRPLYALEGRAPADRAHAHRCNVAIREGDVARYRAWLETLLEGSRAAPTLDALLANGRPVIPEVADEPGATEAERAAMQSIRGHFTRATREALSELDRLRARLEGRRVPLDVALEGSVAVRVASPHLQGGVEASLADDRASAWIGRSGAVAEAGLRRDGVADEKAKLVAGPVTFAVAGDRLESVEVVGPAAVAPYGRVEREALAAGVVVGRALGDPDGKVTVTAQARLGVSLQLLDRETARRALSPADEWTTRRE